MKKLIKKIGMLSKPCKIQLVVALFLTIALMAIIPVYAWFANQKKAAEMFKVEYPNSLYINAAHREDRVYFDLAGININDYKYDAVTRQPVVDGNGDPIIISKMAYVFSVSGSNTNNFVLQIGHTTNNQFTYTVYEATQKATAEEAMTLAGNNSDLIVRYKQHAESHTENSIQVTYDPVVTNATSELFYVRNATSLSGSYLNTGGTSGTAATTGKYYTKTYGDNTYVQTYAVPLYWQSNNIPVTSITDSNKNFVKYFILEVTWDRDQQASIEDKETDIIYFSVKRVN
ncbi:hypothetical protein SAMN04487934_10536 [Eubacterium ruminantium]|nr:hypothetical protein SAMN04487934_10536 [Eubacterium ruminantium]